MLGPDRAAGLGRAGGYEGWGGMPFKTAGVVRCSDYVAVEEVGAPTVTRIWTGIAPLQHQSFGSQGSCQALLLAPSQGF